MRGIETNDRVLTTRQTLELAEMDRACVNKALANRTTLVVLTSCYAVTRWDVRYITQSLQSDWSNQSIN